MFTSEVGIDFYGAIWDSVTEDFTLDYSDIYYQNYNLPFYFRNNINYV